MDAFAKSLFPLGFGTSKLCSLAGGLSVAAAERLLVCAFDQGIRFVDTAPSYGQGHAETAIGRLPRTIRDELILCSKVGYGFGSKARVINALKPLLQPAARALPAIRNRLQRSRQRVQNEGTLCLDIRPATIRESLAGTLRRLRREQLDLLLLHDPSPASLGDENRDALEALRRAGTIGQWGVCTTDPAVARLAVERFEDLPILQMPVNPARSDETGGLLACCAERGVSVIANSVLVPLAAEGSAGGGRSSVETCFEFALRQPGVRMVLCGTTSANHLAANVRAMRTLLQVA